MSSPKCLLVLFLLGVAVIHATIPSSLADDSSEAAKCDKVTPPRNHLLGYEPKPFPKHSLADEPDSLADEPDPPADKPHHKPPHKPQTGYRRLLATENVVGGTIRLLTINIFVNVKS
ncbi:hypothetical protein GH714_004553 [Hevea brasiliensis]|uniref:Uncharacterized protein n=1 Tax=Hevea brasiliensis TaxID=3981 RepID=A0A6A6KD66_HEVBR|nr:hypothetical protein GH714_004553 [Hevea brasiliensis]